MPTQDQQDHYIIHGHVVTPATNEITRDGMVTRIEPKSMLVLVHLFEHAGQVISRESLQDAIWGDVVVGDDSLTNAIIKIRKAFGDDARNPQVIETIPKRGYRLIAQVEPKASNHPSAAPKGRRKYPSVVLSLALAGMALLLLVFYLNPTSEDKDPPAPFALEDARTRIIVAPFQNLSAETGQDYLVHGVEQALLTGLARIPSIAALQDPGTAPADYRLEGSVQRDGARVRVETRLLEAETGLVVSANRYDRAFTDLMAIEAEIEASVVSALAIEIEVAALTNASRGYTHSVDAYELFLKARESLLPRDRAGNERARALYRQAIERDPGFARAYAGLALTYAADYRNGWADDGQVALNKALSMAQTALEIEPNMPEQLWVVGYVQTQFRELQKAEEALNEALSLDPFFADAHALLGGVHTYAGNPGASVPLMREAMRLKPEAGYLYYLLLGRAYYFLGDCDQATINLKEAASRNPANVETHLYLAACLVETDEMDAAEWQVEEVFSLKPDFTLSGFFASYPMLDAQQISDLKGNLTRAGMS